MRDSSFISNFKRLAAVIFLAAALVPFAIWLGALYEGASAHNVINRWNHRRFGEFYELPENTLDLVFIGSSHSYCTFDPEQIDALLGVRSYQLGMPLQQADSSYYTLLEILKTQRPSVVVMELYWEIAGAPFNLKQASTLFEVLRDEATVEDFLKNALPLSEKVKYHFLPVRYQPDFFAYRSKLLLDCLEERFGYKKEVEVVPGEEYYKVGGFMYCDYVITDAKIEQAIANAAASGKDWSFDARQKKYLAMIADTCAENDIELVFVTAPVVSAAMGHIRHYGAIHASVAEFARALGVRYVDYNMVNMEEKMLVYENFRDGAHLNYSGAMIVGEHFARWLR